MPVKGGQTISKAIGLLRVVAENENGSTFTDLKVASGQPKATLHRLLQSMIEERLIRYDEEDRRYRLGYGFLELAGIAWSRLDVRRAAGDVLATLSRESGEAVHMAVLDDTDVIYIENIESGHKMRMSAAIGTRSPAYCTGVGKAIMAFLADVERERVLDRTLFRRLTPKTPATRAELAAQLLLVRRNGYAFEEEEQELGTLSIAAPVFDHRNRPVAGISVTVPSFRCDQRRMAELAGMTVLAARRVTANCGGRIELPEPSFAPAQVLDVELPAWLPEGDVPC